MRSMRHPNPLIDVRRPRNKEKLGLTPPGFVWQSVDGVDTYRLELCRTRKFDDASLRSFSVAGRTMFLLPEPLEPGRWYWRWWAGERHSQVFWFEMLQGAADVKIGSAEDLAARLGAHPRLMVRRGALDDLRMCWKTEKTDLLGRVTRRADELLAEPHEMEEPPFLPKRSEDYNKAHVPWRKAMVDSRDFCAGAQELALAYLLSADRRYAEAVARRLDSISCWDPDGSTSISHNDEPHMSVVNWCPFAFDWAADVLEGDRLERIVRHLAKRAENTLDHLMHWPYHVNPVSNHAGRMIGFLGHCGIALAGHHERAGEWLKYVLELMVAMYPAWGADAGGWAQGFSYGGAYVRWILEFLFSVKTALGIDLYRKPFFRNHGRWYAMCLPEYAWQNPFGDGGERDFVKTNAAVIARHLATMTGDVEVAKYAGRCEKALEPPAPSLFDPDPSGRRDHGRVPLTGGPLVLLSEDAHSDGKRTDRLPKAECFADVGWVAMRRNFTDPDDDICLVLKSSPYGPVSHSHGDQNSFVLSAWGKPLLVRTGAYTGYGSPHHQNWIRQTKSHNGVTVGGVGQWVNDFDAVGRIAAFKRGRDYAYACGDAGAAYGGRLSRFHRHVLFVDHRYFLVVDDLASPVSTTFEWHLHSIEEMMMDESQKEVRIAHEGARLAVDFVTDWDVRFHRTDEFDEPHRDPERGGGELGWHFRAATVPVTTEARMGMLLIPGRESAPEDFRVQRHCEGGLLRARVEHGGHADEFLIATGDGPLTFEDRERDVLALWARDGEVKLEIPRPKRKK